MKRVAALAVLLSAFSLTSGFAENSFEVQGEVTAPNPSSKAVGGITESVNPCGAEDPDLGSLQGLDGYWITLPDGAAGKSATLDSDAVDMDVWFYTGACGLISEDTDPAAYAMATDGTADEAGTIPGAAVYAIVDLAIGADAKFTFAIA